ncbi:ABC transporter permease [uncultured Microbacterium sp.]|uniref:ABC transporter permease n=1 Tax=uncultured Microbacterium sp. TaxID=191216 RepID=UPI0035CAD42D
MSEFIAGVRTMIGLELRQRVRGAAWYVLLGIFFVVLLIVTGLAVLGAGFSGPSGGMVYSIVTFVVLLMASLVTPALSGGAINGDRDAATLAPVQVTLLSTAQIVGGKFLAAWLTGLSFLVVGAPFMIFAAIVGAQRVNTTVRYAPYTPTADLVSATGVSPLTVIASLAVLVIEVGVVAAVGVGLSGIISRPVLSVVTAYLVIAALSVGTLIAFGLGGSAVASTATTTSRSIEWDPQTGQPTADPPECGPWQTSQYRSPRYDLVWGFLAANPYVIIADATPMTFSSDGYAVDLFSQISSTVRVMQKPPILERTYDDCAVFTSQNSPSMREQVEGTVPSWFVGLGIHLLLAAGALWWAIARTRTPSRRLPRGTRIA